MFCEHCGIKIKEKAQFCQSCGNSTSNIEAIKDTTEESIHSTVKCEDCKYSGQGELSRTIVSQIIAWLFIFLSPLITLGYYEYTFKYQCPNCKSTSLQIKNKKGVFVKQKGRMTLPLKIFGGLIVTGIIFSLISLIK